MFSPFVLLLLGYAGDPPAQVRVATFNCSLNRNSAGELIRDLEGGETPQARQVAEIIQRVRPDVLLLNEFDYDAEARAARLFLELYLGAGQGGCEPLKYGHYFVAPVNTGLPSGLDLDRDGQADGPGDAFGFGRHPGQYGMVVYSRFPIDRERVRTFQTFLWRDMPDALLPRDPDSNEPYYSNETLARFRLSSKSHWDVPIDAGGHVLHLLAAHPTPPVFDGLEDRNGRRNHDEIRFWADFIDPARSGYIRDDRGRTGGLAQGAAFVIAGDLNADPHDGDSTGRPAALLLQHPLVQPEPVPASRGAVEASEANPARNRQHRSNPAHDTAKFSGPGNLRIDYLLPARALSIRDCGVFWPEAYEAAVNLVGCSDHRLVWIDLAWPTDQPAD